MYFVADETNTVSLYSQPMDAKGAPQNSPSLLAMTTVATSKAPQYSPPSPNLSAKAEFALPVYFAPDGRRAVLAGEWGIGSILYTDSGRTEPVFRNTIDPQGSFLNWGPDSRHVLIRTEDPDWDLWLVGSDTGDFVKLNNEFHSTGGAVSPDGQKVIYAVQKDFASPGEIWIVDADGTNARRLFTMPGQITFYGMAWSPDGNKIAFMGDGLMIMNADGSNARTISRHSILDNYLFPPIWSPDSRKLAFVTNNLNASQSAIMSGDLNAAAIHLIDVDTGQERPLLLNGTSGNFDPAWSADGSQIAFASTRSGNSEIWVVNVDGTHLRQLTNVGQFARYPYWGRMTGSVQP